MQVTNQPMTSFTSILTSITVQITFQDKPTTGILLFFLKAATSEQNYLNVKQTKSFL